MQVPRLTTRRLMLAVAVAAALLRSAILAGRAFEYHQRAVTHEMVGRVLASEISTLGQMADAAKAAGVSPAPFESAIAVRSKELVEEARAVALYRDRTWRPWKMVRDR